MKRARRRVTIEGLYYAHGLLCASYPISMLAFVFVVVVVTSLPFFVTPSGELNTPKPWRSPWLNYRVQAGKGGGALGEGMEWIVDNSTQFSGRVPSWFRGLPVAMAQQVYVTVRTNCSTHPELCQKSHFSSSKAVAAALLHTLGKSTGACYPVLHPAAISLTSELDPTHPPGVLSPLLDLVLSHWDSDQQVLGFQTTKELLYGGFWQREHSSTPLPLTSSPLTKSHMFSITFLLDASIAKFSSLTQCIAAIKGVWPVEAEATPIDSRAHFIKHFFYEPEWNLVEFLPLVSVYFIVFLYISFSVGKIDLVKSKVGLGVAAIVTLIWSLTMSLGICTFFGLSISLSSSEVYPFFVITLGLENILIIVKAVMSTPEEFEVKQRIAAGLSKEGWAISRNLSTLLLMLCMGIVFFNYTMKEFCIIGLVALLCDAFLQLFFFPTVLSIDLRRLELSDLGPDPVSLALQQAKEGTPAAMTTQGPCPTSLHITPPSRWRSKRVKFAYFLASARLVSRAIMVAMVVSMMVVWAAKTDKLQKLLGFDFVLPPPTSLPLNSPSPTLPSLSPSQHTQAESAPPGNHLPYEEQSPGNEPTSKKGKWDMATDDIVKLMNVGVAERGAEPDGWGMVCEGGEVCWRAMVTTHWPRLLEHYGYRTENRFLSVLPPIMLTFNIGTSPAHSLSGSASSDHTRAYQTTLFLLSHPYFAKGSVACVLVGVVLLYTVWLVRSTARRIEASEGGGGGGGEGVWQVKSSSLKGHTQDVECLCVSDDRVVSASLDGDIRVWSTDSMTQGCLLTISRGELCGDLTTYADKWRPDAEGCEDNKSVRSLQIGPPTVPSVPASFQIGGPMGTTTVGGPDSNIPASGMGIQMTLSVATNQIVAPPETQRVLGRSMSAHNVRDRERQISPAIRRVKPRPQPHPLGHGGNGASFGVANYHPPHSPILPSSPPPSPGVFPVRKGRRHSTHSLQEQVLASQLDFRSGHAHATPTNASLATHNVAPPLPLCGLPTSPPSTTSTPITPHYPTSPSTTSTTITPHYHTSPSTTSTPITPHLPTSPSTTSTLITPHLPTSPPSTTSIPTTLHTLHTSHAGKLSTTSGNEILTHTPFSSPHTASHMQPSAVPRPPVIRSRHTRSKSSGPIDASFSSLSPASPVTHTQTDSRAPFNRKQTHSRNLSTSCVSPPGKGRGFSDSPEIARSSISLNLKFSSSLAGQAHPPDPVKGYDFAKHFSIFSPYTSSMALEYCCHDDEGSKVTETPPPAVWCMDVWNRCIAIGCGNGQIELWNMESGSLNFALSTNLSGATVISITARGIVSGHMDGCLHVVGLDGHQRHTLPAHTKPVSVVKCAGVRVVSGGYDGAVVVHRMTDLERERTVTVHSGSCVTSLALDPLAAMCVSGCGGGVVCLWELSTGNCQHLLQESGGDEEGVAIVKLDMLMGGAAMGGVIVGLMSDETVVVWDKSSGESLYTIALEGMCSDFVVLGGRFMAACVESMIVMYDLESGQKRFQMAVGGGERGVVLVRHLLPLQGTHVVCSTGRDLRLLHCSVKQKVD